MNFTRWSARLPGTQRRAAARTDTALSPDRRADGSVPAARAEQPADEAPLAADVPSVDELPVRDVLGRVPALVALLHGPEHRLAYVNDAYVAAFGIRDLGARAREALPELDEPGLFPLLDQVQRSGRPRTLKSRKAPDGRSYTFTCTPVTEGHNGDGRGVLVFATDVTDHAEAAGRLRASERSQRETAVTLQRSLLPQELEEPDDLRVAATYHPGGTEAAVGGDWYDVITLGGGRTALVIGDVMGRGVRAAAVMGQLRTAVRAYARLDLPPHEVLQLLDGLAAEIDANQIATCVYAIHDPNEGRLVYASAGHLPILVRDEDGTVQRADEPTGPPLGTGGWIHASGSIALPPGSTAVLYTDGLVERRDEDLDEGIAALERALSGATGTPQVVCDRLVRSAGVTPDHDDDVAVLVLQHPARKGAEAELFRNAALELLGGVEAAPRARASPPASSPAGASPPSCTTSASWPPANWSPTPPARHPADAVAAAPYRPPPHHRGDRRRRPPAPPPPRGAGGRVRPGHRHRRDDRLQLGVPAHPGRRQGRLVRVRPAEALSRRRSGYGPRPRHYPPGPLTPPRTPRRRPAPRPA